MSANRTLLLLGSGEFEPWSEEVEREALGDRTGHVAICPAASAPEGDEVFERWASMGLEHYARMGVPAEVVPLRTRADADAPGSAASISDASMVFFSGGNPRYLADVVAGTRFWETLLARIDAGTVFAGCSAGAMVAGRSPESRPKFGASWAAGLGLVRGGSFGPHWDRARYIPGLRAFATNKAGGGWFAGIDERTAILGDGAEWRVFGLGGVTFRLDGTTSRIRAGETFSTPA